MSGGPNNLRNLDQLKIAQSGMQPKRAACSGTTTFMGLPLSLRSVNFILTFNSLYGIYYPLRAEPADNV
jgi:hypothetical protein